MQQLRQLGDIDGDPARLIAGALYRALPRPPQFRQLGKVDRYAPRVVLTQPLVHRAAVRVIVEIEIAQRLSIGVMDDEALLKLIDRPRGAGSGVASPAVPFAVPILSGTTSRCSLNSRLLGWKSLISASRSVSQGFEYQAQ
jgi:hypothetical protein